MEDIPQSIYENMMLLSMALIFFTVLMLFWLFDKDNTMKSLAKWWFMVLIVGTMGAFIWVYVGIYYMISYYVLFGTLSHPKIKSKIMKKIKKWKN